MSKDYSLNEQQKTLYLKFAKLALPRHTSYPTANLWKSQNAEGLVQDFIAEMNAAKDSSLTALDPVSLYLHLPFCSKLCTYCACNKYIVPREDERSSELSQRLITGLEQEMKRLHDKLGTLKYSELHLGGGTPTWLSIKELNSVLNLVKKNFEPSHGMIASVELDPRATSKDHLKLLFDFGFRRVSVGVQDFDQRVQESINRIQPFKMVADFVDECRNVGFEYINFDLIYGLPNQTIAGMKETVELACSLRPTRIAFYRMALIPEIFKWQRRFGPEAMPGSEECLTMNLNAINAFIDAGYEFLGLDHFALPDDPLFRAIADGTINRNFQGMTTARGSAIIGFGPSAISQWQNGFTKNHADFFRWEKANQLGYPVDQGHRFSEDDVRRKELLLDLYCYRKIDASLQRVSKFFNKEFEMLSQPPFDQLIQKNGDTWQLTQSLGELLVRVVAAVFDRYLPLDALTKGIAGSASQVG